MATSPDSPGSSDLKREVTNVAIIERTTQTVQGAHDDLKACELAVAKLRSENTPEALAANDLHKQATRALRRTCKAVHQKAKGAIFFLQRKTELRDCMATVVLRIVKKAAGLWPLGGAPTQALGFGTRARRSAVGLCVDLLSWRL
jgi:hypothetical protein